MPASTSSGLSICRLAALLASACATEVDVDVIAVLPFIEVHDTLGGPPRTVCELAEARALALRVVGPEESLAVLAGECAWHAGYAQYGFFAARLERLADAYHRVDAVVLGDGEREIGRRALPFDPSAGPLVIAFARADLPGWPTAALAVELPACASGGLARVRVQVLPDQAIAPAADAIVDCADPAVELVAPLGPALVTGEGFAGDGAPCARGAAPVLIDRAANRIALSLEPEGSPCEPPASP
jgi:hypothetical protein